MIHKYKQYLILMYYVNILTKTKSLGCRLNENIKKDYYTESGTKNL